MMETGTIAELNLKPGDVVECTFNYMNRWTVGKHYKMTERGLECDLSLPQQSSISTFRIVSRASDNPKKWGDMTSAEKGALLLAAHEGEVIERMTWENKWIETDPKWVYEFAYRIKPEPKRETVTAYANPDLYGGFEVNLYCDHWDWRITFDLIDGEPDVDSIRMEKA